MQMYSTQTNSNMGWKDLVLNQSFKAINTETIVNIGDIFKTEYYNDVFLIIGVESISKTNVMINVSAPITPVGILYNNGDICFEGEAYRYGTQVKITIRGMTGANISSLQVKIILYK